MIASWRDNWLREFFEKDIRSNEIPANLRDRLFRKLKLLDYATSEADLQIPPGNHFERLKGKLDGWRSIRVNQQWRLIFEWSEGKVRSLYLDDHSYR